MTYEYPLPKNIKIKISKPTGNYAHENFTESKYAVDFLTEIGTPVLAARGGIISKVKDIFNQWGLDINLAEKVNLVVVDHKDETYAEYLHFGKGKIKVKEGQEIHTGDLLGYTGYSGVMDEPHLHFNVFKIEKNRGISIPFNFR